MATTGAEPPTRMSRLAWTTLPSPSLTEKCAYTSPAMVYWRDRVAGKAAAIPSQAVSPSRLQRYSTMPPYSWVTLIVNTTVSPTFTETSSPTSNSGASLTTVTLQVSDLEAPPL